MTWLVEKVGRIYPRTNSLKDLDPEKVDRTILREFLRLRRSDLVPLEIEESVTLQQLAENLYISPES